MINIDDVFSVYEVTTHIKNLLERSIDILQIKGEVSNLARPASGHMYFSLKDEKSLIRCVFFVGYNRYLSFTPKNGDNVVVTGKLTVYERDGQYQIIVSDIFSLGIGLLHEKFEKLKEKLKNEGLFNSEHKRLLPKFPKSIGIVTSESGAALQDILNVLSRRYPLDIYLYPALVQGNEAPKSLVAGIGYFASSVEKKVDLIIIGRGGGSYEDLFCFNDEELARKIFACPIPIISAVGHEIDFTICDFVADVRAATPSVAAEIAVPNRDELIYNIQEKNKQLKALINAELQAYYTKIYLKEKRFKEYHPQNIIFKYQQQLDQATLRLVKYKTMFEGIKNKFYEKKYILETKNPVNLLAQRTLFIKLKKERLAFLVKEKTSFLKAELQEKKRILQGLSPKYLMGKGYTILEKDGKIVNSKKQIKAYDKISILLKDGKCLAEIRE